MQTRVEANMGTIKYRATRQPEANEDGSYTWSVEYKQGDDYDWAPRGRFAERAGRYEWREMTFDEAGHALRHYMQHH